MIAVVTSKLPMSLCSPPAAAKACRPGGASAYARKTTPPARALRSPRSLGLAVQLALIRVGIGVSRCAIGETLRTRMGTPAARFSTSPGDRDGRAAGSPLLTRACHTRVRSKNRLQASSSAEVRLSSQASRITSLSNRSLTGLRMTRTGAVIVRHAPEGGFSGRSPRRRAADLPRARFASANEAPPRRQAFAAADPPNGAPPGREELTVGHWELAFGELGV